MEHPVVLALLGTSFTFLATVAGAAMVFFVKKEASINTHKAFLGFAAGVMIAASVWSLLIPAIDMAREQGKNEWLPAVAGFLAGGVFLFLLDRLLPHLHLGAEKPEGMKSSLKRTTMLVLAVTLHNIPEGLAVGLSFAAAAAGGRDGAEPWHGAAKCAGRGGHFSSAAKRGCVKGQSVLIRWVIRRGGARGRCVRRAACYLDRPDYAVHPVVCRRRDDLCGGRGAGAGNAYGRTQPCRYGGRDARLCSDDGVGYCAGIVKTCCCLSSRISLKINRPDWMR